MNSVQNSARSLIICQIITFNDTIEIFMIRDILSYLPDLFRSIFDQGNQNWLDFSAKVSNFNCSKYICLTSLTRAKCGVRSTLCWKNPNISGSIKLFAL